MTEYQVFKWFLLFLILMAAVAGLVACTNPVAPSKTAPVGDTIGVFPTLPRDRDGNFPDWACSARFIQDPGPEFYRECQRRGL